MSTHCEVMTVLGSLPAETLGITLTHEHLLADSTVWLSPPRNREEAAIATDFVRMENLGALRCNPLFMRDNLLLDDETVALQEIQHFRALGGGTIVDTTSVGMGRDVAALRRLSQAGGVAIIAGCGFYVAASHPDWLVDLSVERIQELILRDICEGIDGTTIRAGIIGEIGTSNPIAESEVRVLCAAGMAQRETDLALTIHMGGCAAECSRVLDVLEDVGIDLSRVILGHMDDDLANLPAHINAASRGAYIEYDAFGAEWYFDGLGTRTAHDHERIDAIFRLAEAGFAQRLLISQDVWLKQALRRYGGFGYAHILRMIVPELKRHGFDQAGIDQLLVSNPKRVLTGE